MDRDHYVSKAERQLNDSTFYKPLDHDPTPEFAKQVSDTVSKMHGQGLISEKNMAYLIVDQPKAGRFYLLPKMHKAGNPGRPIVSANGHPTEKISEFVDLHLQSHVQTLPSYLQDTTDSLKKQEALGPIPSDALLVSMDVTSLYTNIPHSDGIKACEEAWDERDIKDPPTQTLVKLLTLVLKCNNFQWSALSASPRHSNGDKNGTSLCKYVYGSSWKAAIDVSHHEAILMASIHWWHRHEMAAWSWQPRYLPTGSQ